MLNCNMNNKIYKEEKKDHFHKTQSGSDEAFSTNKHGLIDGSKKKVVLLIAYCGDGYHGMAMNRGDRQLETIERDLISALVKAKVVPENCWEDPNKMTYKIASRTDKGVSTCGQVASLKLIINDNVLELINNHLPPAIRILAVKRVTKGFSAHHCASARTYSYTLPTFAFAEASDVTTQFRITQERLDFINSIAKQYEGTHSYHNFTSGKQMGEMSAQRFVITFKCDAPFIYNSMEFVTFTLKGQSFMIHQIRKMVGLIIVIVSGYTSENYFNSAFTEPLVDIPKAPGTGLVLERVHYDAYNKKHGHLYGGVDFSDLEEEIEKFRKARIFPSIYRKEVEENSMMEWLQTLPNHDFSGKRAKEDWKIQSALREAKAIQLENEQSKNVELSVTHNCFSKDSVDFKKSHNCGNLKKTKSSHNKTYVNPCEPEQKKFKS